MAASDGFFAGEEDTVVNVAVGYAGPDCPNSFTKRTTRVLMWDISLDAPRTDPSSSGSRTSARKPESH